MGAVLKGRDPDLGRDLAVKVLLASHQDKPEFVRRFVEEAQIAGQLQHPGIVPVYELGAFADNRPYFTMKLVRGRTLATLLAERQSPAHDLPRFLAIFESICQTVAYSHARGVIHRDLKPSNVMVGSFGEVQVMDWGLAKVLKEGGVADESPTQPGHEESVVATVRSGSNLDESEAGSVLGTPAYMAPEQAAGAHKRVDRRSDVFGLGSILCEILTGQTAYAGRSLHEVVRKAIRGDTADAVVRLDACGSDAELAALAKECLAAEPEHRPRDANVVARRITAYLAGVQERVLAAERERAVAVAKAIEERRRRKVQLALAASVLAFTTLSGLSTTYYIQQRASRAAAGQRVIDQVTALKDQALDHAEDIQRWEVALAAVEQADPGGDPKTEARLLALQKEIHAGLDAAQRDKALLDRLVDIRSAKADDLDGSRTDADYANAFGEAGIDVLTLPPAEAGAKMKSRPPEIAQSMALALDDWASVRRDKRGDSAGAGRLGAAARLADSDPWRNELRTVLEETNKEKRISGLQTLAKTARFDELGPISLHLLGAGLIAAGESDLAESILRTAQRQHPRDAWVNYELASLLQRLAPLDEPIRFYTAARAIRPETAHELAHALMARGDSDEALAVFRDLKKLRPGDARHLLCLAHALEGNWLSREASEVFAAAVIAGRVEIQRFPDCAPSYVNLGRALQQQGKLEEALALFRQALRLQPNLPQARIALRGALVTQGKNDEALEVCREWTKLDPNLARAHFALGYTLAQQGKHVEAEFECREAIRLDPRDARSHDLIANLRLKANDSRGALPFAETAVQLAVRPGVGDLLVTESNTAVRSNVKFEDSLAAALRTLVHARAGVGDIQGAVTAYRQVARINPDWEWNLGEFGDAFVARVRGIVKDAEPPKDPAEVLALGRMAYDSCCFADAASLWAKALDADPKLSRYPALSQELAARQAWSGQFKEYAATRQRILALARGTENTKTAEQAAKSCSILPSTDKAELEATLVLARMAVQNVGTGAGRWWDLLALGMAEYRSGNDAAAEKALLAADEAILVTAKGDEYYRRMTGTSAFYRAMSLFRQGKSDEARKLATEAKAKMKPLPASEHASQVATANHLDIILWLAYGEAKALIQFEDGGKKE
jgi:serine/threonine-protein kinase